MISMFESGNAITLKHKEKSHKPPKLVLILLIVVVQEPLKLLTTDVPVSALILMAATSKQQWPFYVLY